jgi:RecA-family ATPase
MSVAYDFESTSDAHTLLAKYHETARGADGVFVLSVIDRASTVRPQKFAIGDAQIMADEAMARGQDANAYFGVAIMRRDLAHDQRGGKDDIRGVPGVVLDDDPDAGRDVVLPPGIEPTFIVTTSRVPKSNRHIHFVFNRLLTAQEGDAFAKLLHQKCGGDHGAKDIAHVWRLPGTKNIPSETKIKRGRPKEPQAVELTGGTGEFIDPDALRKALEAMPDHPGYRQSSTNDNADAADDYTNVDWQLALMSLPESTRFMITSPAAPGTDRSKLAASVITTLDRLGWNRAKIAAVIRAHPQGIGARYQEAKNNLEADIRRILDKYSEWSEEPKAEAAPEAPFVRLDMSHWDHEPPPERRWSIYNRVPQNQAGLFSGEGGTGKSIIELTKNVAHVAGKDWLGSMPERGPAVYIGTEDDEDELRRRLVAIAKHYGVTFEELIAGGLHVFCLLGRDATLCAAGKSGRIETTRLYNQVREIAGDIKPRNMSIDTLSRAFAGNEIDRVQVYAFAMHMQALAMAASGSVTVLSHPSLQGMSSGSGISGSTAWHGAFRFRQYLTSVKSDGGEPPDDDLRELQFKKNQYGPKSESVVVRYQDGLFLPVAGMSSLDRAARDAKVDATFIDLLRRLTEQGQRVGHRAGTTYAPAIFAGHPAACGVTTKEFAAAMQRLLDTKKIRIEEDGSPSRRRSRLVAL